MPAWKNANKGPQAYCFFYRPASDQLFFVRRKKERKSFKCRACVLALCSKICGVNFFLKRRKNFTSKQHGRSGYLYIMTNHRTKRSVGAAGPII
jgi:hypothetical protein